MVASTRLRTRADPAFHERDPLRRGQELLAHQGRDVARHGGHALVLGCPFRQNLATLPCPPTCRPRTRPHAPGSPWPTWYAARSKVACRVQHQSRLVMQALHRHEGHAQPHVSSPTRKCGSLGKKGSTYSRCGTGHSAASTSATFLDLARPIQQSRPETITTVGLSRPNSGTSTSGGSHRNQPGRRTMLPNSPTLEHAVEPNGERWGGVHGEARGGQACSRVRSAVVLGPVSCRQ
jgi:hypothetical protein